MALGKTANALESEEGLEDIYTFLRQSGVSFSPKNETRISKRLRIMAKMLGSKSFSDMLLMLHTDLEARNYLLNWLSHGKVYDEDNKTFIALVTLDKTLEKFYYLPKRKKKRKKEKDEYPTLVQSILSKKERKNWSDSKKGLSELLRFLRDNKVRFLSKDEQRIGKRLKIIGKEFGLKNYSELLFLLNTDPQSFKNVLNWLEKGRVYNEKDTSYTPLVKRKNTVKNEVSNRSIKNNQKGKNHGLLPLNMLPGIQDPPDTRNLSSIFKFLTLNNINYEAYKEKYFLRRLHSRMMKIGTKTYRAYLEVLATDPKEINSLIDNLSINVTHFFRDKDLWTKLERKILPKISSKKAKSINIWSAGCAIGPEPYSIALIMKDKIKNVNFDKLNIFATDISQEFLTQAQAGVYSKELLEEIDPSKMQSYFKPLAKELYQLSMDIRRKVIFKTHDLRSSPPFRKSYLDLILCRNVLIYFSRSQSEKLFRRFYSVLKPNGYLVLGKCELVPIPVRHMFKVVHTKTRIYQRVEVE